MRGYTCTDEDFTCSTWYAYDVACDDIEIRVAFSRELVSVEGKANVERNNRWVTNQSTVLFGSEYLSDVLTSLKTEGEGELLYMDSEYDHNSFEVTRDAEGRFVVEFSGEADITVTLAPAQVNEFVRLFEAQIEALDEWEAERVRVKKTFAEWQRIIEAHKRRGTGWRADTINEQISHRGYLATDEVEVVFDDAYESEDALSVTIRELSATVDTWQRTIKALNDDRLEIVALGVEEALEGHIYGASPLHEVTLSFDWNEADQIESVLWRVALFGEYTEAVKPFATLVMVG